MKKIGILTFHNAHNWGAALQVYALKKYLIKKGYNVSVINYKNHTIESNYLYSQPIKYKVKSLKSCLKYFFLVLERLYARKQYVQKWEKFNRFIQKIIDNQVEVSKLREIEKMKYNYIICGSDQIWNYTLTNGFDKAYFCDFKTDAVKISYAASMGLKCLPKQEEEEFKNYIQNFDYISVREEELKKYINSLVDNKVEVVLDPTLLLEKEDYNEIEQEINIGRYLLVYTLKDDKKLMKISKYIAKKMNLKIIELRYEKTLKRIGKHQIANVGPEDFLGLINNAEFIITNSFHGTVFSIIYNKLFYTIPVNAVNSRIENLLTLTKLNRRLINSIEDVNLEDDINFEMAMNCIKKNKKISEEFLEMALK